MMYLAMVLLVTANKIVICVYTSKFCSVCLVFLFQAGDGNYVGVNMMSACTRISTFILC